MAVRFDIIAGTLSVADRTVSARLLADGGLMLDPDGERTVVRRLTFAERATAVAAGAATDDPEAGVAAAAAALATVSGTCAEPILVEAIALHLCGADEEDLPAFAATAALLGRSGGWSLADIAASPAVDTDRLVRALAPPAEDDGWTRIRFVGGEDDARPESLDRVRRAMARNLLARYDPEASADPGLDREDVPSPPVASDHLPASSFGEASVGAPPPRPPSREGEASTPPRHRSGRTAQVRLHGATGPLSTTDSAAPLRWVAEGGAPASPSPMHAVSEIHHTSAWPASMEAGQRLASPVRHAQTGDPVDAPKSPIAAEHFPHLTARASPAAGPSAPSPKQFRLAPSADGMRQPANDGLPPPLALTSHRGALTQAVPVAPTSFIPAPTDAAFPVPPPTLAAAPVAADAWSEEDVAETLAEQLHAIADLRGVDR